MALISWGITLPVKGRTAEELIVFLPRFCRALPVSIKIAIQEGAKNEKRISYGNNADELVGIRLFSEHLLECS